jgi:hypothetical protein
MSYIPKLVTIQTDNHFPRRIVGIGRESKEKEVGQTAG